jgi:hypothetical protein
MTSVPRRENDPARRPRSGAELRSAYEAAIHDAHKQSAWNQTMNALAQGKEERDWAEGLYKKNPDEFIQEMRPYKKAMK